MTRSKTTIVAFLLAICAMTLGVSAQTVFLNEDFSSASGSTPPAGWMQASSGTAPIDWRYDNPNGLSFSGGLFIGTFAVADSDFGGSGTSGNAVLTSPPFDVSSALAVNLSFDHCVNYLSGESMVVEVWDGVVWNAAATYTSDQGTGVTSSGGGEVSVLTDITVAAGAHTAAQLQFSYLNYTWDYWWAVDNVSIVEPAAIDVAAVSIDSIAASYVGDCQAPVNPNAELVTFTVQNLGGVTLAMGSSIPARFFVDGGLVSTEMLPLAADLLPGATAQLTFAATADLSANGPHTIDVQTNLAGDGNPMNNTANFASVTNNLTPEVVGWFEDFEGFGTSGTSDNTAGVAPLGWINDPNDPSSLAGNSNSDWYAGTGTTGSTNGGPLNGDHTTGTSSGWYMNIEDSSNNPEDIQLITPCLDPSAASNPNLAFWHHSDVVIGSTNDNILNIDVIDVTNAMVVPNVASFPSNGLGSDWTQHYVDLSAFSGSIIKVVFRISNFNSPTSFIDDVSIDDVGLIDLVFDIGQAPQAGLASFDIDGSATNLLGGGVGSGQPGPYFVDIVQGGPTTFAWNSLPNQAATCFFAPLNRNSAFFPGVGQTDVGIGALDPVGGYPTDILVFGDGINWYTNPGMPFSFATLWISDAAGNGAVSFLMPPLQAPGSILTTFQMVCLDPNAPFFHMANAIEVTLQ